MLERNIEFVEELDAELDFAQTQHFSEAVLHSADWTVETVVSQLMRGNIEMNPRFQRRDAWSIRRKSSFIESLILGLPVPQIVLAEKQGQRGKYIVLDGKQRLLSLLQFTGNAEGPHNKFRLQGLEARVDLTKKRFENLQEPAFEDDLNAFLNYTVRTVVIRNWPNYDFLHLVFLRLNTGSVKLSPQELRQAMFPGEFSDFVDDKAVTSEPLHILLGCQSDPRMRDVELLVRFLGFHFFLSEYGGRMKDFLDLTCDRLNRAWHDQQPRVEAAVEAFNKAVCALIEIFGENRVARKANSASFNRGIFDALVFYAANDIIRAAMEQKPEAVLAAYDRIVSNQAFLDASESNTSGVPNTFSRLYMWGKELSGAIECSYELPSLRDATENDQNFKMRISFEGFRM
ncbi:uncharacterized protein DUF262 [Nitrosospira multiformis]|uniref:Uncharacterized protein DUF262 n=2 Tax=Nitrosospira multiformis TaxID=1231 RepID=A0A2T5I5W5_9PROT|nr:uncharacterized protein DUF262 [Nitrosospira multiformis]